MSIQANSKQFEIINSNLIKVYRTSLAFEYFLNVKLNKQNANILAEFFKQAFQAINKCKII